MLKIFVWVSCIVIVGSGFAYLKRLKSEQEKPAVFPISIEMVRARVGQAIDLDSLRVVRAPVMTTLRQILDTAPPITLINADRTGAKRTEPFETQVWKIKALVKQCSLRIDQDLYMVIEEEGRTGSVEVPLPIKSVDSPFIDQIQAVRLQLENDLKPTVAPKKVNRMAEMTGIGFFGTRSKKDNGARLMPLLTLKWLDK